MCSIWSSYLNLKRDRKNIMEANHNLTDFQPFSSTKIDDLSTESSPLNLTTNWFGTVKCLMPPHLTYDPLSPHLRLIAQPLSQIDTYFSTKSLSRQKIAFGPILTGVFPLPKEGNITVFHCSDWMLRFFTAPRIYYLRISSGLEHYGRDNFYKQCGCWVGESTFFLSL